MLTVVKMRRKRKGLSRKAIQKMDQSRSSQKQIVTWPEMCRDFTREKACVREDGEGASEGAPKACENHQSRFRSDPSEGGP